MRRLIRKDATLTDKQQQTRVKQRKRYQTVCRPFWRKIFPLRTVDISSRICSDTLKTTHKELVQEEKGSTR